MSLLNHHFTAFYFSKCNWFSEPPEPKGYREKWLIISPASVVQCAVPYLCPTSQCQKGLDCFNFLFTVVMQNVTCWGKLGKGYVKSLPYHFLQLHMNSQWSQNKSLIWRTEDLQGQYFPFICFYWVYNISNFLLEVKIFLIEETSDLCERNPEKWGGEKTRTNYVYSHFINLMIEST